jgi:P27 family predicted phage terminase small subunit
LELVKLEGNPGHRKVSHETPKFKPILPKAPAWLDSVARKEWRRIGPELERLGLLTSGDMAAFAAYCAAYSMLVSAQRVLKREGMTFETANGYKMPLPEVAISNTSMKLVKDFCIQFGFTPSSRGRMQIPDQGDGQDEDLD